jgi:hypothetical protein
MEASGSSSYLAATEETIVLDEDPDPHPRCGQQAVQLMDLPLLALV